MIHYLLQTLVFMLLFLVVYDLFLKKETFFFYNRLYLILTPIASFLLPVIKIDGIQEQIPQQFIVTLPAVIIGGASSTDSVTANTAIAAEGITASTTLLEMLTSVWIVGMFFGIAYMSYKVNRIIRLKNSGIVKTINNQKVVLLPDTDTAFTFFNTIFLGAELSNAQQKNIMAHEQVHVKQKHFIDLLFFELLRIVFWFNPLVYIFQKRMSMLQEFSADAAVASQIDKRDYYQELLSQVFNVQEISFINTFFNQSFIKKRIIMLQKTKSKKIVQLKYLLLVPVILGMLIYTSCSQDSVDNGASSIAEKVAALQAEIDSKERLTAEEAQALSQLTTKANSKIETIEVVETENIDVPFAVLDKAPIFPGCEQLDPEATKKCFQESMMKFVGENFNTKPVDDVGLSGRQRISVIFKIDSNGNVQNVQARAPHPELEAEAMRVVGSLPTMIPGENNGKKVNVLYNLPIVFEINE